MKILTLNTHSLSEENGERKCQILAQYILNHDIDIVTLQEVNQTRDKIKITGDSRYCGEDVLKLDNYALLLSCFLEEKYYWTYIPVKVGFDIYDEGLAIFSKKPIEDIKNIRLTHTNEYTYWKKRNALLVKTDDYTICTTHFGWWEDEEEPFIDQWHVLQKELKKHQNVYLTGDFNAPRDIRNESYDEIIKDFYDTRDLAIETKGYHTIPGHIAGWDQQEGQCIDYIMSNKKINVKKHYVIFDKEPISDHYGIVMEE